MGLTGINTVIAGTGIALAASLTLHHVYRIIRADKGGLHESLADYYRVLTLYVSVTGLLAASLFTVSMVAENVLVNLFSNLYFLDLAFLGLTLVWLGTARQVFKSVGVMADTYFSEVDTDGS